MAIISIINADPGDQYIGQIVRTSGSSAVLARADSTANIDKILGFRLSNIASGGTGYIAGFLPGMRIRMDSEPTIHNKIWLSATNAGNGVVTEPTISVLIGVCVSKENVSGIWYATCVPVALSQTPTTINLSNTTPEAIGATVTSGVSANVSRDDHSHAGSYDLSQTSISIVVPRNSTTMSSIIQFPLIWDFLPAGTCTIEMAYTLSTAVETAFQALFNVYVGSSTTPNTLGGTLALATSADLTDNGTFLFSTTGAPGTFTKPTSLAASQTMVQVQGRCWDPGVGNNCTLESIYIRIMGTNVP